MVFRPLEEIKRLRKKFHLNQKELADRAGVSQSLIAKIEAGTVEPTFSKAKQIFEALEELQIRQEVKAEEIMNKKIAFAQRDEQVKDLIKIMRTKGISQLPILHREKICGIVTESTILKKFMEQPERISRLKAEDVMEETPPIVSRKTGFRTLTELLRDNSIVLVAEKGDAIGLISKSDLLRKIE